MVFVMTIVIQVQWRSFQLHWLSCMIVQNVTIILLKSSNPHFLV